MACVLIVCTTFYLTPAKAQSVKLKETKIKAPLAEIWINVPDFSKCPKLSITDFGAVQGDKQKTSQAIAGAIEKANKLGGGTVIVPPGEWLTGRLHFKSNVNLHLAK